MTLSRREVLAALAGTGAAIVIEPGTLLARPAAQQPCGASHPGILVGTLPLFRGSAPAQPFGVKLGGPGLDARVVTDLSVLDPGRLITPNSLAFVRTERPRGAAITTPWTIALSRPGAEPRRLTFDEIARRARNLGPHLIECSGNNNPANFGLMSVCEWEGARLSDVIARDADVTPDLSGVVVAGVDHEGQRSADSVGGASWWFPLASLDRIGAFLAVRMNGEPIPPDHGAPVRLVVPGWYGCAWIKWVNEIRLTRADEPASTQMREFAGRTHQTGAHELAADYAPAEIQTAAVPIRVEKRRVAATLEYRIIGIVWGGAKPIERLAIRFHADEPWTSFSICPAPATNAMWSLWEFRWKPAAPGVYDIALSVPDRSVPQRRLDAGYYMRQVRVDEI
jgi:DMSO/TMAO reductase YedYZ molybdopterin-dependent catalytic subunit